MYDDELKFSSDEIKLLKQILSVGAPLSEKPRTIWALFHIISQTHMLSSNHWGSRDLIRAVQYGLTRVSKVVFDDACKLLKKIELFVLGGAETSFKIYENKNTHDMDTEIKSENLKLLNWQEEALTEWENNSFKGIVHAVTGSGKSYLGLAAIERFAGKNPECRIIILVPTIHLLKQWLDLIIKYYPSLESQIGARGGNLKEGFSLSNNKILILTYQSALRNLSYEINVIKEHPLLFIADECHRYGSEAYGQLLSINRPYSALGLSAYPFRLNDDGFKTFIEPRIGNIIYSYDYEKALQEGVICGLEITFINIPMNPVEEKQYEYLTEQIHNIKEKIFQIFPSLRESQNLILSLNQVIKNYQLKLDSFNSIKREYLRRNVESLSSTIGTVINDDSFENDMSAKYGNNKIEIIIRQLFCLWIKRQILIHRLNSRFECTMAILKSISPDNRIFLFHQYIEEVETLATALKASTGHKVITIHSGKQGDNRTAILKSFKSGENNLLVSCRVLDEGVDVPDANVAIFSAISKSPTQIIQRTGRILRPQKKKATLFILYAGSTVEKFLYDKAHELFKKVFPCKTIEWSKIIEPQNNLQIKDEKMPENENISPETNVNKTAVPEIVLVAWRWYNNNGNIYIEGEVENKSNRTFKYVKIVISARDDDGNFLGTGSTFLNPYVLAPYSFSIFQVGIYSISHEINNILIKYTFNYNDD